MNNIFQKPTSDKTKMPAFFISHGGGPCFWMDFPPPLGPHAFDHLRDYLSGIIDRLPQKPRAILMISAHWECPQATVSTMPVPNMIYDYYGFTPHTYELNYPAPAALDVAERTVSLLSDAGIPVAIDPTRGYDHGVFVPMMIIDPSSTIPIAVLSLQKSLDPQLHLDIGAAIAPLRDDGVLIIGSGNTYHNLRHFMDSAPHHSEAFDQWLMGTITGNVADRAAQLVQWSHAPSARECHPRAEHLLPLMVVAGAAGQDQGHIDYHDRIGAKVQSGYVFT